MAMWSSRASLLRSTVARRACAGVGQEDAVCGGAALAADAGLAGAAPGARQGRGTGPASEADGRAGAVRSGRAVGVWPDPIVLPRCRFWGLGCRCLLCYYMFPMCDGAGSLELDEAKYHGRKQSSFTIDKSLLLGEMLYVCDVLHADKGPRRSIADKW
eukprot:304701-Prymnesium_polylepis.1